MATKTLAAYEAELNKEYELVITRTFDAPRSLVYKAFSESGALAKWWGPKGSHIQTSSFEFKPGGKYHYFMESPYGKMWGLLKYVDMKEPEMIAFINSFSDEHGGINSNPFLPDFPLEILNVLSLTEHGGKATLTLRGNPINANDAQLAAFGKMHSSMQQGFVGTFDALEEYMAGKL